MNDLMLSRSAKEQAAFEAALPAMMLMHMAEEVVKDGYEFRSDISQRLQGAVLAALSPLNDASISAVACRLDQVSRELLRDISADDPQQALYASAMFTVTLVHEGLLKDPHNMAVLVSLLLLDELQVDGPAGPYRGKQVQLSALAGKLLIRSKLQGIYLGVPEVLPKEKIQ